MNAPMTKFAIMRANREKQERQKQRVRSAELYDADLEFQEWAARQRANALNAARLDKGRQSKNPFNIWGW